MQEISLSTGTNYYAGMISRNNYTDLLFVLFCRWLDKLGLAARLSHDVVIRQTFVAGNYALLDANLEPNPVCTSLMKLTNELYYFAFLKNEKGPQGTSYYMRVVNWKLKPPIKRYITLRSKLRKYCYNWKVLQSVPHFTSRTTGFLCYTSGLWE